jgi:hypothetical protein
VKECVQVICDKKEYRVNNQALSNTIFFQKLHTGMVADCPVASLSNFRL